MGNMTRGALTSECHVYSNRLMSCNQNILPTTSASILHRANDEGTVYHKRGEHGKAFDSFTEAIRLHPSSATYHANRAAAALRLQQFDTALQDARCHHVRLTAMAGASKYGRVVNDSVLAQDGHQP